MTAVFLDWRRNRTDAAVGEAVALRDSTLRGNVRDRSGTATMFFLGDHNSALLLLVSPALSLELVGRKFLSKFGDDLSQFVG